MRHFGYLTDEQTDELFAVPPEAFDRDSPPATLAMALGATLYSPGTRARLADDSRRAAAIGATSHVWCLEDSIAHADVPAAQANVVRHLQDLHAGEPGDLPLLFVRVRSAEQVLQIAEALGPAATVLTGFVLPKIAPDRAGEAYLQALERASELTGVHLYGLPVLEHDDLAWHETRRAHLTGLRALFDAHTSHVLSLRVGGTDLCGLFGLRRDPDTTIYDVTVVRDALGDVINTFARKGHYSVSGPVWEHLTGPERMFKSRLRQTPFAEQGRLRLRQQLLQDDADGLLREVLLDRANGFHGKTVIHPTHVGIVNSLLTVSREEYDDARTIAAHHADGGVLRSAAGNKMNELGPHGLWSEQVLARAAVYGVTARPSGVVELLQRSRSAAERHYPTTVVLPDRAAAT